MYSCCNIVFTLQTKIFIQTRLLCSIYKFAFLEAPTIKHAALVNFGSIALKSDWGISGGICGLCGVVCFYFVCSRHDEEHCSSSSRAAAASGCWLLLVLLAGAIMLCLWCVLVLLAHQRMQESKNVCWLQRNIQSFTLVARLLKIVI